MILDLAVLRPGGKVTDDRIPVPGRKEGVVLALLPPSRVRVRWFWPGVCAGHSIREESIENLSEAGVPHDLVPKG